MKKKNSHSKEKDFPEYVTNSYFQRNDYPKNFLSIRSFAKSLMFTSGSSFCPKS